MVHLHGLDLGGEVHRGEGDDHAGLDDAGLHSTDGYCPDAANFVDILSVKKKAFTMLVRNFISFETTDELGEERPKKDR